MEAHVVREPLSAWLSAFLKARSGMIAAVNFGAGSEVAIYAFFSTLVLGFWVWVVMAAIAAVEGFLND